MHFWWSDMQNIKQLTVDLTLWLHHFFVFFLTIDYNYLFTCLFRLSLWQSCEWITVYFLLCLYLYISFRRKFEEKTRTLSSVNFIFMIKIKIRTKFYMIVCLVRLFFFKTSDSDCRLNFVIKKSLMSLCTKFLNLGL